MTIKEVAQIAGVSAGTVSNVLNKKPHVDPRIRERVEAVIERTGYRINIHARGMIKRRSFNVGIIIPSLSDPFFPRFAESMELDIEQRGSNVIITSSRHDPTRERELCELLMSKQVDGFIITPCARENTEYFNALIDRGVSIVQLGRYFESIRSPIVRAANRNAGREALSLLYAHGHRNIIHLAGDPESSPDAERGEGFLERASELDLLPAVSSVQATYGGDHRSYSVFREAIGSAHNVTAVFANDDLTALGCLKACRELGIAVPDELSLVSVGGFYDPRHMVQSLSTFAIDAAGMSRRAVDLLYRRIEKRDGERRDSGGGAGEDGGEPTADSPVEELSLHFVPGETLASVSRPE